MIAKARPLSIAVRLTGGMGDVLLASTYIEALHAELEHVEITAYYHTPAIAEFVFSGARFVHAVKSIDEIPYDRHAPARRSVRPSAVRADVIAYTGHFPRLVVQDPERVAQLAPASFLELIAHSEYKIAEIPNLIAAHPKLDGLWARMVTAGRIGNYLDGLGELSGLDISCASRPFLALDPAKRVVPIASRNLYTRSYITVHDGFDNRQHVEAGKATKQWPLEHWQALVALLHEKYPDLAIVQLGAGKSRPIAGVDVQCVNATTLPETAWLIKNAAIHVDTDSGLAHLAYALHTPAVVLFGPTNASYFGHEPNLNLSSGSCADCWWSTPDWLAKCPRGLAVPACMQAIKPDGVAAAVAGALDHYPRPIYSASYVTCYDGMSLETQEIADAIASVAELTPGPITGHLVNHDTGVYVHASKQWEYAYAYRAIEKSRNGARHRFPDGSPAGPFYRLYIADVGGGRGAFARYLAARGATVEQYDRDYEWTRGSHLTEARYRQWAARNGYRAEYGSIYNLPAETGEYDVVLCISVLEHLPEKKEALRELLRLLKPGGICVLTFDFALEPERFTDAMRVAIADPERLDQWIVEFVPDLGRDDALPAALEASILRIQQDGVAGIPIGMTVAGLTITRTR